MSGNITYGQVHEAEDRASRVFRRLYGEHSDSLGIIVDELGSVKEENRRRFVRDGLRIEGGCGSVDYVLVEHNGEWVVVFDHENGTFRPGPWLERLPALVQEAHEVKERAEQEYLRKRLKLAHDCVTPFDPDKG